VSMFSQPIRGQPLARGNDRRARNHPSYWAFVVHRVSGVVLAVFLPIHFWTLAAALQGAAGLEQALRYVDAPLFKLGEWVLVVLLALHLGGGLRLLLIEFGPWSGLRKNWIAFTAILGIIAGLGFALALFGY
jgi:fumarate reductase subunit D